MNPGRIDNVGFLGATTMTVLLALLLGRVGQLQWRTPVHLADHMHSRETRRDIASLRGNILDRRSRLLATTEFGYRVFVDPQEFPREPGPAIGRLADALGVSAEQLAGRVVPRLVEHARRASERRDAESRPDEQPALVMVGLEGGDPAAPKQAPPIRYVRVSDVLPDEVLERVKPLTDPRDRERHVPGVHLELRSVRQYPAGSLVASIVGKVGAEETGLLGAEHERDDELGGEDGSIRYIRDVMGRPLWMGPGAYEPPEAGADLRLSLDLELQRMAEEELARGVEDANAAGGRLLMMDPLTGEVLAMVDLIRDVPEAVEFPYESKAAGAPRYDPDARPRPRYRVIKPDPGRLTHPALGRNRCVEDVYEPGSTFKSFVWAAVTDLGKARPDEVFHTNGRFRSIGRRTIEDVHPEERQTWREVLVNSSNIGMSMGVERVSFDELRSSVLRLGFGKATGIGLPGEAAGLVTARANWRGSTQTSISFGYEVAVTPLQIVRAYCAFARPGDLAGTIPPARLTAMGHDDADRSIVHRVFSTPTARTVREIERAVAANMEALMRAKGESGWRYDMFGKSGTSKIPLGKPPPGFRHPPALKGYFQKQYYSSFIGGAPAENPRLVILVIIDDPGPERVPNRTYFGSHVAGPVVRRLMDRSLAYQGVPPSPPPAAGGTVGSGAD